MAWFKVDDGFSTSPKVLSIPRTQRMAAVGLWTLAGTWCAKHLTDGAVPSFMLEEWGADVSLGTLLVEARLWSATRSGYQFHAWAEYQPSRTDVEAIREKERQRKQAYREKRTGQQSDSPEGVPPGVPTGQTEVSQVASGHPIPSHPDPSHPVPKGTSDGARKRGTRIPDPFIVTGEMRAWAAERCPGVDVNLSTERFVNYWRAKAGKEATKVDWKRTWNNWMLNDQERAPGSRPSTVEHGRSVDDILRSRQDGTQLRAVGS
jgi:hypothetical protein